MAFDTPDLDLYHPWDLDAQHSIDIAKACEEAAKITGHFCEASERAPNFCCASFAAFLPSSCGV
jgi:PmbA protein